MLEDHSFISPCDGLLGGYRHLHDTAEYIVFALDSCSRQTDSSVILRQDKNEVETFYDHFRDSNKAIDPVCVCVSIQ